MTLFNFLRRAVGLPLRKPQPAPRFARSIDADFSFFREGDRVVIHAKHPQLTKPLQRGSKTDVRRGSLDHESVIGHGVRERFPTYKGPEYRLSHPSLDEYVALTPRLVTPIYAADASLIVSLLDIHVAPAADHAAEPPLEILESGTGHGSLTLHLARAIQAANPPPPTIPSTSQIQHLHSRSRRPGEDPESGKEEKSNKKSSPEEEDPIQHQWDTWRAQRKAVIHTVDVSPKFSAHAEKIVRGFRRGMYVGNVDFYAGHVEDWIAEQIKTRSAETTSLFPLTLSSAKKVDPFLTHAILDMPSANQRIPHVAAVLRTGGLLAVFMPSVTQIGECVELIRKQRLPFAMEKVVELGNGISGGRLWDVRLAVKKSRADPSSWSESEEGTSSGEEDTESAASSSEAAPQEDQGVLVCRPKVGTRIVGGGFVGIWRRIEDSDPRGVS